MRPRGTPPDDSDPADLPGSPGGPTGPASLAALRPLLQGLRPTQAELAAVAVEVEVLRRRLVVADAPGGDRRLGIRDLVVHGSLRRGTALRPPEGAPLEVDLLLFVAIPRRQISPEVVQARLLPALRRLYPGRCAALGREITIVGDRPAIRLRLVIVAAGGRGRWGADPLYIPSREASRWEPCAPYAQWVAAEAKGRRCGGHFSAVVRALKSWRRGDPALPRIGGAYPLEHLIGRCCPDGIRDPGEGIVGVLGGLATGFTRELARGRRPSLASPGLPEKDVLARVSAEEFAALVRAAARAASLAERARAATEVGEAAGLWGELLGLPEPGTRRPSV